MRLRVLTKQNKNKQDRINFIRQCKNFSKTKIELIDGVEIGGVAKYIAESNNSNSSLFI